ncbi:hypothetical protein Trco_007085 [Trichoderma cornu-damae]|uniref:Uncharacterized protein n=1 Tax=Trichoderma cornu-damae TaxID=654480 RepID=A0A9P8TUI6_9HYPO|nr:hypothetical protein Trco_007085 [Trichoderma cornu-damae]
MYPYFKFTNCEWTLTRKQFRSMFFDGDKPNAQFEALISHIMYRRKEVDLWIPVSTEEQIITE